MTGSDAPPATVHRDGALAHVVIGRPHVRGALDVAARAALAAALREVSDDDDVRCVVLSGSGGAFSAGQDLREHAAVLAARDEAVAGGGPAPDAGLAVVEEYVALALLLARLPKPVVASVRGTAAGAGAALAMACDLRLLAASARVDVGFTRVGLSPDTGASWWLPRLVGEGRARDLLLRPRPVPAAECLAIGLATEVVEDDALDARVEQVARQLADGPTAAYAATRQALAFSAVHDLPTSLAREGELAAQASRSPDHRHAVEAFLHRRG
ncbi:enoyl-CoA hydratase/isomerase family protein [Pseudokineococcus sp. 1T1Z-3]|uniref:enoyl-CoA hydratase/isomerase family protein n=1 Tax=Pseudokineococcus sp. 1T1Z-3 TaxID=3132745 RepID=UPI0030A0DFE7